MPKRSTLGAYANIYTMIVTNAFDLGMTKKRSIWYDTFDLLRTLIYFLHIIGGIFGKIVDYFYFCQKKKRYD